MKDILSEIIAHKRKEVAEQKGNIPYSQLEKELAKCDLPVYSLKDALLQSDSGIIAEFKRRSPSKGWINKDADAGMVTKNYAEVGAAALSVLTDEKYFGGTLADLQTAAKNVSIPVMRKEFIVDEYQILQARLSGASAILLIAAALTVEENHRFTRFAKQLNLDVLLELHDEKEVEYVSSENTIVGINNRNLGTFVTDLGKSYKMIELLPKDAVLVSESGISNPETVQELRKAGYKGFLIGENFMKTENPGENLRKFIENMKKGIQIA
ncbi:MAG: indole-3-glycerol phosphate synthase TrpC [Bacteroidia bacterium]|nr:indole-3-glycerol phosphate synthase TrpC [Bacteroidia bacterium]